MDLESIEREALQLPVSDRAKLAHELLESLDTLSASELEQLWLDEAERRAEDLQSGKVVGIPADEVMRKARALLK